MSQAECRLYFAFGSNLHAARMRGRVPSARVVAVACLPGYALAFRKRGADGSAKCDLRPSAESRVWGVVYRIARDEQPRLDAAEGPGYRVTAVTVETKSGSLAAFTYRARAGWYTAAPPADWYRDLVVAGARDHGLPAAYVECIAAAEAVPDPRGARSGRGPSAPA